MEDYYKVPKAAEVIGVARSTFSRWILEGRIPNDQFLRIGRNYRIKKRYVWDVKSGKEKIGEKKNRVYLSNGRTGDNQIQSA